MARGGGKRKRKSKKVDTSKLKFNITKKRGKTVVTAEKEVLRSTAEVKAEIKALKEAKIDAQKVKARRRRAPAPIEERKALDYNPVDAGMRKDSEAKRAQREAMKPKREAARARRKLLLQKKEERGKESVSLTDVLGGDFFSADGIAPE
eukprot:TRINITY_DN51610_c0_g1_i1.p1 TRINITY_DN51610_c0_g1~~TRINITY_DN51610_c0_g1_i1.p1  ORF type:complete len:149 (+),score=45.78 TRINITY_DN51610_c0_g1_i1:32-478(+)